MKTIKLEVNSKIYDKILWFLSQFDSKDLKIVSDFSEEKKYLSKELEAMDKEEAHFISVNELDAVLEERIIKYED
jgi:hypothetical protein